MSDIQKLFNIKAVYGPYIQCFDGSIQVVCRVEQLLHADTDFIFRRLSQSVDVPFIMLLCKDKAEFSYYADYFHQQLVRIQQTPFLDALLAYIAAFKDKVISCNMLMLYIIFTIPSPIYLPTLESSLSESGIGYMLLEDEAILQFISRLFV